MNAGMASVRACAIAVGLIGIGWGTSEFSIFRRDSISSNIAARILAGDLFKPQILLNEASLLEQAQAAEGCRPLSARSAAIVRLRIAEFSNASGLSPAPVRTNVAVEAIRK